MSSKKIIEAPKLPKTLANITQPAYHLQPEDEFSLGIICDCTIDSQTAGKVSFDKIVFQNVTFTETSLTDLELTDIVFERCDLSNVIFHDAIIHRTAFYDCKMIGVDLTGATFRNVQFHRCIADYATFRFSNAKQALFQECSLCSADFYNAAFQKVYFSRSNMDRAQMTGVKLEGIDLSDCEFDALGAGLADLQGCVISREQASVFAKQFGLAIKE
ncbi:pentapeptide repeat-containing protein [Paenibacillus allorhizosphaerae]|uniref:Pentapeptide repeat-containing protein n=1 Tax=Paenibacillus allorhizosphaerae TaxID=2849866 RepID=A0ABN7TNF5_9BACL|nr:pentapeptide repeat-containing protein [Paenibacillus allorhizosphaerae]CAG7648571.1 hypothetical protein PAECIP111802_04251 [Paenibacillus allorhizosphaerae]